MRSYLASMSLCWSAPVAKPFFSCVLVRSNLLGLIVRSTGLRRIAVESELAACCMFFYDRIGMFNEGQLAVGAPTCWIFGNYSVLETSYIWLRGID